MRVSRSSAIQKIKFTARHMKGNGNEAVICLKHAEEYDKTISDPVRNQYLPILPSASSMSRALGIMQKVTEGSSPSGDFAKHDHQGPQRGVQEAHLSSSTGTANARTCLFWLFCLVALIGSPDDGIF